MFVDMPHCWRYKRVTKAKGLQKNGQINQQTKINQPTEQKVYFIPSFVQLPVASFQTTGSAPASRMFPKALNSHSISAI